MGASHFVRSTKLPITSAPHHPPSSPPLSCPDYLPGSRRHWRAFLAVVRQLPLEAWLEFTIPACTWPLCQRGRRKIPCTHSISNLIQSPHVPLWACSGVKIFWFPHHLHRYVWWGYRDGLLDCCSQTLELHPTGGQTGAIFAVLLHAGKGNISLNDWLPERSFLMDCFALLLSIAFVHHFLDWHLFNL